MANTIKIDFPQELANSMRLNKEDFGREVKIASLVKLFELGKVSSGIAAQVLEMTRIEFLELLERYKVSYLDTETLEEDIENA